MYKVIVQMHYHKRDWVIKYKIKFHKKVKSNKQSLLFPSVYAFPKQALNELFFNGTPRTRRKMQ